MLKTEAGPGEPRETLVLMTSLELTNKQQKPCCFLPLVEGKCLERDLFRGAEGGAQILRKTFQKSTPHSKHKIKTVRFYSMPAVC